MTAPQDSPAPLRPPRRRLTRAERKDETRDQLLDAARVVFGHRGFNAATVGEVAEYAGFTKGAVYSHFGSKDELLLALVQRQMAERIARIEARLLSPASSQEYPRAVR